VSEKSIIACEYDSACPLVICPSNQQEPMPRYLQSFEKINIDYIGMLDNDQFYVIITQDQLVSIYSVDDPDQSLFQYNLTRKSQSKLFDFQINRSNIIIFMFKNAFLVLKVKFDRMENTFQIQSEQNLSIPNRDADYSLEFTPNQRFLILKQSLNQENNPDLYDLRIFTCNEQFQISPTKEPITHIKSKMAASGKIIGFTTYVPYNNRSELWIAHQGLILHVRLPSHLAELDIRSNYHSWLRHSLALYAKTAEKTSLSIAITSLAVQSSNDSCLVSGADDGSIIIWHLTDKCSHEVLESIHMEKVNIP
jgi:WD40 repeat protein